MVNNYVIFGRFTICSRNRRRSPICKSVTSTQLRAIARNIFVEQSAMNYVLVNAVEDNIYWGAEQRRFPIEDITAELFQRPTLIAGRRLDRLCEQGYPNADFDKFWDRENLCTNSQRLMQWELEACMIDKVVSFDLERQNHKHVIHLLHHTLRGSLRELPIDLTTSKMVYAVNWICMLAVRPFCQVQKIDLMQLVGEQTNYSYSITPQLVNYMVALHLASNSKSITIDNPAIKYAIAEAIVAICAYFTTSKQLVIAADPSMPESVAEIVAAYAGMEDPRIMCNARYILKELKYWLGTEDEDDYYARVQMFSSYENPSLFQLEMEPKDTMLELENMLCEAWVDFPDDGEEEEENDGDETYEEELENDGANEDANELDVE